MVAVLGIEPSQHPNLRIADHKSAHAPMFLFSFVKPMERIQRSSIAYRATTLPLSYIGWSQGIRNFDLHVTSAGGVHLDANNGTSVLCALTSATPAWSRVRRIGLR
jgi:hypothetical protein